MVDRNSARPPSAEPGRATAEQGMVLLECPQGAIVTLTPEAAEATCENLRRAALAAYRQRLAQGASDGSVVVLRRGEPES